MISREGTSFRVQRPSYTHTIPIQSSNSNVHTHHQPPSLIPLINRPAIYLPQTPLLRASIIHPRPIHSSLPTHVVQSPAATSSLQYQHAITNMQFTCQLKYKLTNCCVRYRVSKFVQSRVIPRLVIFLHQRPLCNLRHWDRSHYFPKASQNHFFCSLEQITRLVHFCYFKDGEEME